MIGRPTHLTTDDAGVLPIVDAGGGEEVDPWFDWQDPDLPPHPKVTTESLAAELRRVLRYALPLTVKTAGPILPNLRSVIARSVHPYDPESRVDSLNQLLVRVLVDLDADDLTVDGQATRTLFGIAPGTKRLNLHQRQQRAATILSYDPDHFRKHVQIRLLEPVAVLLYRDLLRYKRRIRRAPLSEEPTGDTPTLTDRDLTHQEELVSRIWQHVYGWRAELIATARLEVQTGYESQAADHQQASQAAEGQLRRLIAEYADTYGERLIWHGDAEFALEAIARLVGRAD